jgi:hypothetical protein
MAAAVIFGPRTLEVLSRKVFLRENSKTFNLNTRQGSQQERQKQNSNSRFFSFALRVIIVATRTSLPSFLGTVLALV